MSLKEIDPNDDLTIPDIHYECELAIYIFQILILCSYLILLFVYRS